LRVGPKVLLRKKNPQTKGSVESKNPPTLVKTLLDFASVFRQQIVGRKSWRGILENETPSGFTLHIIS
jgi:hypothetical protein